jgi:hypothetical protein
MRISDFLYPPTIARCQHIKVNGVQCGSPALKRRKLCHFHQRWQQGRIQLNANRSRRSRYSLDLPILEDANSIQVALMQGMRLLLTNQVDHRTAALLFYALQTASSNLARTTFEPRPQQVVIDPRGIADTSLGDDAWYKEEFADADQEAAAPDDELAADNPKTVNLQAMAECPRAACRPFALLDSDSEHGVTSPRARCHCRSSSVHAKVVFPGKLAVTEEIWLLNVGRWKQLMIFWLRNGLRWWGSHTTPPISA